MQSCLTVHFPSPIVGHPCICSWCWTEYIWQSFGNCLRLFL